jgi:hypothetical protein
MINVRWRSAAMAKTKLTQSDREALQRALAMARAESEQERAHIDRELAEQGWQHAAETYHCQDSALRLKRGRHRRAGYAPTALCKSRC